MIPAKRYPEGFDPNHERRKVQRSGASHKFRLIQDTTASTFVDLIVEIVTIFSSRACDVLTTDYTTNTQLRYRPAPEETNRGGGYWPGNQGGGWNSNDGPYGQQVLEISLLPPHSDFVTRQVKKGDIVLLQNVRIKYSQMGNLLEGSIFPDQRWPTKLLVQRLTDSSLPEVAALLERRRQYLVSRGAVDTGPGAAINPHVPPMQPPYQPQGVVPAPYQPSGVATAPYQSPGVITAPPSHNMNSKAQKKKKAREGRKVREQEEAEAKLRKEEEEREAALRPNKHIRCSNLDTELMRLQDILDVQHPIVTRDDGTQFRLPYVNLTFRARVKVLDYLPKDLEDFAVPYTGPDSSEDDAMDDRPKRRWAWSCQLFVQDALIENATEKDRLIVNVGHREMQYMLGNDMPDADDLRRNTALRKKLSEKLAILWGDLEECKKVRKMFKNLRPKNLSFDCCIVEYGTLKAGGQKENPEDWERQYMLSGINIL